MYISRVFNTNEDFDCTKYILLHVLLCSNAKYFYEFVLRFIIQHVKLLCPCGIFIYGECVTEVCEAERNWRGKSS